MLLLPPHVHWRRLFRAKGFLWFQQQREQRYIFHLSGKQRAECGAEGPWQRPPTVQLVLIGQHQQQLHDLQQGLQRCVSGACNCLPAWMAETAPVAAPAAASAGPICCITCSSCYR